MKKKKAFVIVALSLVLVACGGGGGGGSGGTSGGNGTTASSLAFPIQIAKRAMITNGQARTFTASGSCSGRSTLTHAPSTSAASFEGVGGRIASIQTVSASFSNCTPATLDSTQTYFYDANYLPLGSSSATQYSVFAQTTPLPASVKVGDTGSIGTRNIYSDSTKTVPIGLAVVTYAIEADTANTAIYNEITRIYNSANSLTLTEHSRYRISQSGPLELISVQVQYANGITLNFSNPINGAQQIGFGYGLSTSDDGRYIAFIENEIIYRLDTLTGERLAISVSTSGTANPGMFGPPALSGDGQFVLFPSNETNLVNSVATYPKDTSNSVVWQLYVRDIAAGKTNLVTIDRSGTSASNERTDYDVYRISRNGEFVVFTTEATNLVGGINHQEGYNVFLRNLKTNTTELISVSADGQSSGKNESNIPFPWNRRNDSASPNVSADGRYVVFQSMATNLVTGVSYTDSDFGVSNIFVRDLITKKTTLVSISPSGTQASNGYCSTYSLNAGRNISNDGKHIVFYCRASNLTTTSLTGGSLENIYLRDLSSPNPVLISIGLGGAVPNGVSGMPVISADGNYIAFSSSATNLSNPGLNYLFGSNIFRWTRATNQLEVVTTSASGTTGSNSRAEYPVMSDDGQVIAYSGNATNLTAFPMVPQTGDERQNSVFRWNATTRKNVLVSQYNDVSLGYAQPNFTMPANGKTVVFSRSVNGRSLGLGFASY